MFVMPFLFFLKIFYIFLWDVCQSPVALYQFVSYLVLDYYVQDLKKALPNFGKFSFLHIAQCLLDGLVEGILLFDIVSVKYFYFGLHGHP